MASGLGTDNFPRSVSVSRACTNHRQHLVSKKDEDDIQRPKELYRTSNSRPQICVHQSHADASLYSLIESGLMRKITPISLRRAPQYALTARSSASTPSPLPPYTTFFSPCRSLAQVQTRGDAFPEVWFTSSGPPRRTLDDCGHDTQRKPPDERTLKLGKSKSLNSTACYLAALPMANHGLNISSSPDSPNTPPHPSCLAPSTRNTLPAYNTSPFPLDTPPSSDRLWTSRIPCRVMDCAHGMGSCPHRRQRQTHNHQRAGRQKWTLDNTQPQ